MNGACAGGAGNSFGSVRMLAWRKQRHDALAGIGRTFPQAPPAAALTRKQNELSKVAQGRQDAQAVARGGSGNQETEARGRERRDVGRELQRALERRVLPHVTRMPREHGGPRQVAGWHTGERRRNLAFVKSRQGTTRNTASGCCRRSRPFTTAEGCGQHWFGLPRTGGVRHGGRLIARSPGLALAACASLALGIGGTTAAFTMIDAALLRPWPYREAGRLVVVSTNLGRCFSVPAFRRLADGNDTVDHLMAAEAHGCVVGFEGQAVPGERPSRAPFSVLSRLIHQGYRSSRLLACASERAYSRFASLS